MSFNNSLRNYLNLLRWMSALLVVLGHLRSFVFVNYPDLALEQKTIIYKIFYFITGFGHQGVVVFFVISGYLVGGKVVEEYYNNKINQIFIKKYFINRFSRIYAALIPALLFGYMADTIGYNFFDQSIYLNAYNFSALNFVVIEKLNFEHIIGNILNLQSIATVPISALGSNGPLWSLSYEWWYYVLFVMLFINRFTLFFVLALILIVGDIQFLLYSVLWLLGSVTKLILRKRLLNAYLSILILICALIFSRAYSSLDYGSFITDLLIAISIVFTINSISYEGDKYLQLKWFNSRFADFSYSLYLFHLPFIVLIVSALSAYNYPIIRMQPSLLAFLIFFIFLAAVYVYSYLMFLFFENKTNTVRNRLYDIFLTNKGDQR